MQSELQDYWDILLGRIDPPTAAGPNGVGTLAVLASAFYGRAKEIESKILEGEREGIIIRGSAMYRFRTGELRSFIDMAKNAYELGSRLITLAGMEEGR